MNWSTQTTLHNKEIKEINEAKFIETIRLLFLSVPSGTTRSQNADNSSLIYFVLTNKVMQVSDAEYHGPLGKSDHCVITFKCD